MSNFDLNQQCPCGLGKKIKFCCKDIASDLEKILRATDGRQYEAALRLINKSLEKHPERQSLWALKLTTLMETDQMEAAKQANGEFLRVAPENPVALANDAIVTIMSIEATADDEDEATLEKQRQAILSQATTTLHRALANCSENIPIQCFEALGIVGQLLIEIGHIQPGREHLLLQYAMGGQIPTRGSQLLLETGRSQDIPLLLKQETSLPVSVDWVQWKEDYLKIRELALRGGWTQAADQIAALIEDEEEHPVLLRAHAALRCRLPDPVRATAALRAAARHKDIPLDEAAEAEALAQLLDPEESGEETDFLKVNFPISDADAVLERLQSDRRAQSIGMDFSSLASEDGPPPKAGFAILDREMPTSGRELTIDAVPVSLSEVLLFGKQTDREARLEIIISRIRLEEIRGIISEIAGETLTGNPEEEVLGQSPVINEEMLMRPNFPPDTPLEFRNQYLKDKEKHLLLDRWPKLKNPLLDNKTPEEVAGDPEYRRRLLGTILMMENVRRSAGSDQFDLLRRQLGLPVPAPIKPKAGEVLRLHLVKLPRLDPTSLGDDDLATVFVRASQNGVGPAILSIGREMVSRERLADSIKPAEVYGRMSQYTADTSESIELLKQAQEAAVARGESPGKWLVSEFAARIMRGEGNEAQTLLNRIQSNHINEPAVAQLLMQTLQRLGLISPDGQPAGAPPTSEGTMEGAARAGATTPTAPAAVGGGVWTPESAPTSAPAAGESGEKKLWIPGMD